LRQSWDREIFSSLEKQVEIPEPRKVWNGKESKSLLGDEVGGKGDRGLYSERKARGITISWKNRKTKKLRTLGTFLSTDIRLQRHRQTRQLSTIWKKKQNIE